MTVTVDIPPHVLERARRFTASRTDEEAVLKVLEEYAEQHDQRRAIPLLGTFETLMSAEELDEMRRAE